MRTPKEYTKMLNDGYVEDEVVGVVLFSINKRAKNYREKEKETREKYRYERYAYDKYDNEEKYREKKEEYYAMKSDILDLYSPLKIHRSFYDTRLRIYDYEGESYESNIENAIYSNYYFDDEKNEEVHFIDILEKVPSYFLYYEIGNNSFHSPVDDIDSFESLEITDIDDNFKMNGENINDLLSVQFCKKVYSFLMDKKQA